MADQTASDQLDRHALVMAIWAPAVFLAAALLHKGLVDGAPWWIAAGFAALLAGFTGHVIANAVIGTGFTSGETALGMAVFSVSLVALVLTVLIAPKAISTAVYLPFALGLASLVAAVILYLVIAHGVRKAFQAFDVIRDNNPRPASRLRHRGGRR